MANPLYMLPFWLIHSFIPNFWFFVLTASVWGCECEPWTQISGSAARGGKGGKKASDSWGQGNSRAWKYRWVFSSEVMQWDRWVSWVMMKVYLEKGKIIYDVIWRGWKLVVYYAIFENKRLAIRGLWISFLVLHHVKYFSENLRIFSVFSHF